MLGEMCVVFYEKVCQARPCVSPLLLLFNQHFKTNLDGLGTMVIWHCMSKRNNKSVIIPKPNSLSD